MIYETLNQMEDPGPEAQRWLEAVESGEFRVADDAEGHWLAEIGRWLYGERGAKVVIG